MLFLLSWANPFAFWLFFPALVALFFIIAIWRQRTWRYQWFPSGTIQAFPHVKLIFRILAVILLIFAAFGPVFYQNQSSQNKKNIWFLLDISESMQQTQIELAKNRIHQLTEKVPGASFGLIVFSSAPLVQVPLTSDIQVFKEISSLVFAGQIQSKGTNVRKALHLVADRLELSEMKEASVIILTDADDYGENFQSSIERLNYLETKILWIGVEPISNDEKKLQKWANLTNSKYFNIQDKSLESYWTELNSYPQASEVKDYNIKNNSYQIPLFIAFLLLFSMIFLEPRRK